MEQIQIRNLTFSYPGKEAGLCDINFSVKKGAYILLCGQSGSGKTTLLRHLKSVLTPYGKRSGDILMNGVPLEQISQLEQSSKIGYVMQNPDDQIVTDTVWHELSFGLENIGCPPGAMGLRVAEMASFFGIEGWFYRKTSELSGGQKQLLNLASIMAMQPEILILDEPTSQLDPIAASDFLNTLRKINLELGTTVIITEHRTEDIFPVADRVVIMDGGRIIADDTPRNVGAELFRKNSILFDALPAPMRVFYQCGAEGTCPLTVREGREWLNREYEASVPVFRQFSRQEYRPASEITVEMKEVWFRYEKNSLDVLRGVSLQVPRGSLFAIVGGNGAGKSTTLRSLCGTCRPYRGEIRILGKPLRRYQADTLFHHCLSMLPQDPRSLFVKKTVREELEEMAPEEKLIQQISDLCDIRHLLDTHPYDLSGGEQQRTALAKVLMSQPKILLLDEPTKALDCRFKNTFAQLLKKLKEQGITIIMVSHDVEFCAEHADMVSMFFDGQVMATDTPGNFFGSNSFYTTAANRMSRSVFEKAVTAGDVVELYRKNREIGR